MHRERQRQAKTETKTDREREKHTTSKSPISFKVILLLPHVLSYYLTISYSLLRTLIKQDSHVQIAMCLTLEKKSKGLDFLKKKSTYTPRQTHVILLKLASQTQQTISKEPNKTLQNK